MIKLFTTDTTAVAPFTWDLCSFCNIMSALRAFSERLFHMASKLVFWIISQFLGADLDNISLFP